MTYADCLLSSLSSLRANVLRSALTALGIVGTLALLEIDIPDVLDRSLYVILGSFLGVNAVNGVRKMNGTK